MRAQHVWKVIEQNEGEESERETMQECTGMKVMEKPRKKKTQKNNELHPFLLLSFPFGSSANNETGILSYREVSSKNSTRTCVTPPREPVRPIILVIFASLGTS